MYITLDSCEKQKSCEKDTLVYIIINKYNTILFTGNHVFSRDKNHLSKMNL